MYVIAMFLKNADSANASAVLSFHFQSLGVICHIFALSTKTLGKPFLFPKEKEKFVPRKGLHPPFVSGNDLVMIF